MAYALFADRKLVLDGELNNAQLQQTQRSNEQYALATQTLNLQQQLTSMNSSQSGELSDMYQRLSETDDSDERTNINDEINAKKAEYEQEVDNINRSIYNVSVKENAIEMEVKRLDTMVTTLSQQMQAVEQAEGQGIQNATPKFGGVG